MTYRQIVVLLCVLTLTACAGLALPLAVCCWVLQGAALTLAGHDGFSFLTVFFVVYAAILVYVGGDLVVFVWQERGTLGRKL